MPRNLEMRDASKLSTLSRFEGSQGHIAEPIEFARSNILLELAIPDGGLEFVEPFPKRCQLGRRQGLDFALNSLDLAHLNLLKGCTIPPESTGLTPDSTRAASRAWRCSTSGLSAILAQIPIYFVRRMHHECIGIARRFVRSDGTERQEQLHLCRIDLLTSKVRICIEQLGKNIFRIFAAHEEADREPAGVPIVGDDYIPLAGFVLKHPCLRAFVELGQDRVQW